MDSPAQTRARGFGEGGAVLGVRPTRARQRALAIEATARRAWRRQGVLGESGRRPSEQQLQAAHLRIGGREGGGLPWMRWEGGGMSSCSKKTHPEVGFAN